MVGMPYPKQDADIVTISHHHKDHDNVAAIGKKQIVIDWPGEYEINGVRIFGYQTYHDKQQGAERGEVVMFKYEIEDMAVLHCGDIGLVPEASFFDTVGSIDVLLIPVGGVYTINPSEAAKLVQKIDASIVIPMHYNHDKLNQEHFGQLARVDEFLKEMASEGEQAQDKLSLKKDDIQEDTKVIVMNI
jgi:L-ascorbate metabolism protein UlaG (beta-lactamase superfamily)